MNNTWHQYDKYDNDIISDECNIIAFGAYSHTNICGIVSKPNGSTIETYFYNENKQEVIVVSQYIRWIRNKLGEQVEQIDDKFESIYDNHIHFYKQNNNKHKQIVGKNV